jgi:hypothetical protein
MNHSIFFFSFTMSGIDNEDSVDSIVWSAEKKLGVVVPRTGGAKGEDGSRLVFWLRSVVHPRPRQNS